MASIVQINNSIKTLAAQNAMIQTTFFGTPTDKMAQGDVKYPLFAFDVMDFGLDIQKETINYQFWFLDQMKADKSNEEDALSDMVAVSNDMVAALKNNTNDFQLVTPITRNRISEDTPDNVCGLVMNISIYQPYTANRCQIPTI